MSVEGRQGGKPVRVGRRRAFGKASQALLPARVLSRLPVYTRPPKHSDHPAKPAAAPPRSVGEPPASPAARPPARGRRGARRAPRPHPPASLPACCFHALAVIVLPAPAAAAAVRGAAALVQTGKMAAGGGGGSGKASSSSASSAGALESSLDRKFQSVTNTMESIQGLSSWCIENKKHHSTIVYHWMKWLRRCECGGGRGRGTPGGRWRGRGPRGSGLCPPSRCIQLGLTSKPPRTRVCPSPDSIPGQAGPALQGAPRSEFFGRLIWRDLGPLGLDPRRCPGFPPGPWKGCSWCFCTFTEMAASVCFLEAVAWW